MRTQERKHFWYVSVMTALAGLVLVGNLHCQTGGGGGGGDNTNTNESPVNGAPTASAGTDQTVAGGEVVALDGSASSDPDGDALDFAWTQTAGTNVTLTGADTDSPTFTTPNQAGALAFQLTVDDGNGGTDTDTVTVNVNVEDGNQAPVADAGDDQTVEGGASVTLDGSGSSADGNDLTFTWTQTAGTDVTLSNADTVSPSFTAPDEDGAP